MCLSARRHLDNIQACLSISRREAFVCLSTSAVVPCCVGAACRTGAAKERGERQEEIEQRQNRGRNRDGTENERQTEQRVTVRLFEHRRRVWNNAEHRNNIE